MKRKKLVLFMLSAFLCLFFGAAKASRAAEDESTAEIRMLNDLVGYVYQCESMYSDVLWVLDGFDRFDEARTWESLEKARASLAIAKRDIESCGLPEAEMTLSDQIELMRRGVDVSFMENLAAMFDGERTTILNICGNLHYEIMEGVFLQDDWTVSRRYVSLLKELIACDIQYLADTSDWVLASLGDASVVERFHGVMESYCPRTYASQDKVPGLPEMIEEKADRNLDRIEDLLLEQSKIIGASTNRLNAMTDLIEQGDLASIGENILPISGMPLLLFYPVWYDDRDIYYYWRENGEVAPLPAPGTVLERIPDGCRIKIPGVSKDEVEDYRQELENAGLPSLTSSEENGKLTILYGLYDSVFALIWQEDSVSILMTENPVCFVPRWYPAAKNAG